MPDRRSSPDLAHTLGDLYPSALASDPSELADQAAQLFTQHARKHEQHVRHFVSFNDRLQDAEGLMQELKQRDERVEQKLDEGFRAMATGFAEVKLERTVDRTKVRTTFAVLAVVWTGFTAAGGVAWHYLTQPSCRPDQALVGDRCVQVTSVVVKQ